MALFPNVRHLYLEFVSGEWSEQTHASTPDRSLFSRLTFPQLRTIELTGELNGIAAYSNAFLERQSLLVELTVDHTHDLLCLGTSSSLRGLRVQESIHDNPHGQPFRNCFTSLSILRIPHRPVTYEVEWPGSLYGLSCLEVCLREMANVMVPSESMPISNNINRLSSYLYPGLMELGLVVHIASYSFFNGYVIEKCVSATRLVRITLLS